MCVCVCLEYRRVPVQRAHAASRHLVSLSIISQNHVRFTMLGGEKEEKLIATIIKKDEL